MRLALERQQAVALSILIRFDIELCGAMQLFGRFVDERDPATLVRDDYTLVKLAQGGLTLSGENAEPGVGFAQRRFGGALGADLDVGAKPADHLPCCVA